VTLTVRYFAWLRERVGEPSEEVETEAATVAELVDELRARDERHALALLAAPIGRAREVAFFPPMTGG
jgi:molybdopterin synthase sulfur carrier subunit